MLAGAINGMDLARRGAAFLYEKGAEKVWVFGSVAKGRPLDFRSDVDLAVEGLPPELFLCVGAQLEELVDFPIDLVEVERASAVLRDQIFDHGILIPRED